MAKAVIYARFSCSKQREASIEDQLRVCHEWCEREGHQVVAEYCDRAASGRNDDRPSFQQMIANAGESDLVVVYMMDRFSRDVYDAPIYKRRLKDKGVKVVSATESMPDGPEAILIESIYEAMAAMESAHISQRVKRGMDGNAMKCMHNGVRVFGYDFTEDGRYRVNEGEAEVVREIFQRKIEGEAPNAIAKDLALRGWKNAHGRPFSHSAVDTILHSEKYKGIYIWGDTRIEGGMPRIVEERDWEMAQHVRARKVRRDESWSDYAFAGRCVCMECGMNAVGVSGRGNRNIKYSYYRCSKKCGCKPVRAEALEADVVDELRDMLKNRDVAMEIARKVSESFTDENAERRLEEARRSHAEAERGLSNLMRAVEGGMDYADARGRIEELKAQREKAELDMEIWSHEATIDPEDFADFLQYGATLDDRTLLDAFVWQVLIGNDEITVILNYDIDENEPARIEIQREFEQKDFGRPLRVLYEFESGAKVWCSSGKLALSFPRAA